MIEDVHEPLELYQGRLKDEFAATAAEFFEALLRQSGVDEKANGETVALIRSLEKQISNASSSRSNWRLMRGIAVFLIIVASFVLLWALWHALSPQSQPNSPGPIWTLVSLATLGCSILLIVKKFNPAIRELDQRLAQFQEQLAAQMHIAWEQLAHLNQLYDWGMIEKLVRETVPRLALDPYFSTARYEELRQSFGWQDAADDNRSVIGTQSGTINGNPFLIAKTLDFAWGEETYHGSLTISWQEHETYRDSNGNQSTRWVTRSETLHASVTKLMPRYSNSAFLIYGNEAAPDLSFSRVPSPHSKSDGGFFDKWSMDREINRLEKLSRNLDDDSNFTIMAYREFDALFGATNRDNETQFRLLFTPLAQQQMVFLLKDQSVGYGDDFRFQKAGKINLVHPDHLDDVELVPSPERFKNYDLADARRSFNAYANDYFKHIYFTFAPVLAIPLYQQHRSDADIYRAVHSGPASFWEYESLANYYGQDAFRHPDSSTLNILKTTSRGTGEVAVTAYGFCGEARLDYVSVYGGDGCWHNVPVHWTEYLPVRHTREMGVRETDIATRQDFAQAAQATQSSQAASEWQTFFRKIGASPDQVLFRRSLASVLKD